MIDKIIVMSDKIPATINIGKKNRKLYASIGPPSKSVGGFKNIMTTRIEETKPKVIPRYFF